MNEDDRKTLFPALACVAASLLALGQSLLGAESATVRNVALQRLASATCTSRIPTHARISGIVSSVRHEADGDYHVSVCAALDVRPCVVVEVIPQLSADKIVEPRERAARPKAAVRRGDLVEVEGITRWDSGHRWWEIHPATSIKALGHGSSGKGRK